MERRLTRGVEQGIAEHGKLRRGDLDGHVAWAEKCMSLERVWTDERLKIQ